MKNKKFSNFVKPVIWLVLAVVFYFVSGAWPGIAILSVLQMAAAVLFIASFCTMILRLITPRSHRGRTLVTLAASMLHYIAALVILCWGLSLLGVDVTTIVASVGIVTLVVGFGAESLIADVITGIFMLFENQYNVGDIVEVNGFRGTVSAIGIRTTSIMDTGKNIKIINNSAMNNILNRSDNASIASSVIDIPYSTDLEALEEKLPALMEEIYNKHADVMLSAPKYLGVQELGASAITLKFIAEVNEDQIYAVPRILNRELLLGFRKLGVECPFPQLDVHSC